MLFNSLTFAVFFVITYGLYICMRHRMQNVLLLIASYTFYGFWDWRFLTLIIGSTLVDYFCGLAIHRSKNRIHRARYLAISIFTNLGLLGFFKYFDFFAGSLRDLALGFGWQIDPFTLNVVLPVGISFYTFQTMSYTIDIYRGSLKPTRNLLDLAVFVAFFPQLVAGPIERAAHLLPQVQQARRVTQLQFQRGLWLIFLGLFKKVFIADNLAPVVDRAFGGGAELTGAELLIALYAFAFQIYGDFSGYSDIARGISKLMGFDIMLNFRMPYFARNAREFWHRWHISLSTWLRDYLYISMGGGRGSRIVVYRNLMVTMVLGGLWHGAAWTFIIWGAYQGALLSFHRVIAPWTNSLHRLFRRAEYAWTLLSIFVTFHFVCLGWLIFRANTPEQILQYLQAMMFNFGAPNSAIDDVGRLVVYAGPLLALQLAKEWSGDMYVIERLGWISKGILYFVMAVLLLAAGASDGRTFIYFQF
jgi:D-alanyl-lipoteichoic acid acyltransferase DltB (MBOAT superfamily)